MIVTRICGAEPGVLLLFGWPQREYEHEVHVSMLTDVTASCVHVDISAAKSAAGVHVLVVAAAYGVIHITHWFVQLLHHSVAALPPPHPDGHHTSGTTHVVHEGSKAGELWAGDLL